MSRNMEIMPEFLKKIKEAVHDSALISPNIETFEPLWKKHVETAKQKVPDICVESNGEILYLNGLSPGCQACKSGTWDCIFITMQCNLGCQFCLIPNALPKNYAGSIFGPTPEEIVGNHAKTDITGISFSGGEPFFELSRLLEWSAWFKERHPEKYYWIYTNGLLVHEEALQRLAVTGIDEIRFNMAATGYDHPDVMRNLALAVQYIPNVTVEIPAVPEHAEQLLSCLAKWCDLGVKFLNLHEVMYEAGTNSELLSGKRKTVISADGHLCEINPESRELTLAVIEKVHEEGIPLKVNDCSFQSKVLQLRGRRKSIAPLVKSVHERLLNNEVCESFAAYKDNDVHFFHPDFQPEMQQKYPDYNFIRLVRTAPLNLRDPGKWIAFDRL